MAGTQVVAKGAKGSAARPRARAFVDYSLRRRAVLQSLRRGVTTSVEVCDAQPYLLRAAQAYGEPIGRRCPICSEQALALLRYVYSDELGQFSGRLRTASEVVEMATQYGRLAVYVVEVCRRCRWNHLMASYVVGDGEPRKPPRRQRTIEDDDYAGPAGSRGAVRQAKAAITQSAPAVHHAGE